MEDLVAGVWGECLLKVQRSQGRGSSTGELVKGTDGALHVVCGGGWNHGAAGVAQAGQVRWLCWRVFVPELLANSAVVVKRGWLDKSFAGVRVTTLLAKVEAALLL